SGGLKIHPNIFDQIMSEFFENMEDSISYFFFGYKDEKYGEILYLAIETTDKKLENKLMNELKMHFPSKYLPKKIIFIKQFEKTWNGKIDIPSTLKKYGEI
ncbi:MAG: AMP-binding enzyme C-terminal domain, partial [Bacteroidota bacterium]